MKKNITSTLFTTALVAFFFASSAQNTNPWPATGDVGIGTATPDASLSIVTHLHPGDNQNLQSMTIKNSRPNWPIDWTRAAEDIFTVYKQEVDNLGNVSSLSQVFNIDYDGDTYIDEDISVAKTAYVRGELTVDDAAHFNNAIYVSAAAVIGGTMNAGTVHSQGNIYANGDGSIDGELTIGGLASGANKMVVANQAGQLEDWDLPSLNINGSNLELKSGTNMLLSSVPLPSSADNLGNHTATISLNMNSKQINNCAGLTMSGDIGMTSNDIVSVASIGFSNSMSINGVMTGEISLSSGNFKVNGNITATGTITPGSDRRFKKNIESVSNISSRLFKIKAYEYNFRKEEFNDKNFDDKKHFGFIAQEVKEIFPDLAPEIDEKGYMGVNYFEFIPLLLQALKEEDQKVKELEAETAALRNEITAIKAQLNSSNRNTGTGDGPTGNVSKSVLEQNVPNPFSAETRIRYSIAEKYTRALIGIYDLNGKEVRKMDIETGKGEVVIPAKQLQPGMYVYSLIVDGALIDSKRMVMIE